MSLYESAGDDEVIANAISTDEDNRGIIYTVFYDIEEKRSGVPLSDHICSCLQGFQVGKAGSAGFDVIDIPAATYAVFETKPGNTPKYSHSEYDELAKKFSKEYFSNLLSKSDWKLADTQGFSIHYDIDGREETWISITK